MSFKMKEEISRHQKGWESFARMLLIGTTSVIAIVGFMAIFLL